MPKFHNVTPQVDLPAMEQDVLRFWKEADVFGKAQAQPAHPFDASLIPVRVGTTVDEAERLLILRTLEATGQNKTRAAEILGVSLKTLHNKLKQYARAREEAVL